VLRFAIFVGTGLLVGCPSTRPEAPRTADDTALRVRVAQAEARRSGGVDELVQLATSSDVHARELALRGLGRIGGATARQALEHALADRDPHVVAAALGAIGVAASLDEDPAYKPGAQIVIAEARAPLAALEALGRAGDAGVQPELAARLTDPDPEIATAAALALGRHGRRKIALASQARAALATATRHPAADVRYAATYALAREHEPPNDDAANAALAARIADNNPETRATAIAGLARRKALAAARKPIEDSLRDRDWRVAVEAVRALAGGSGDEAGRAAVAAVLAVRARELVKGNASEAHVIIEALRAFAEHPPPNKAPLVELGRTVGANAALPALTRGWIECLAQFDFDNLLKCPLPDHLRLPLLADLAKTGGANEKRGAIRVLLAHDDPRVRAAGLTVLPETWQDADAKGQATIVGTVASALATKNPIVAGTAVDVAGTLDDAMGADHPLRATLDAAVLARATTETDVELASSLYALIGKRAIAGGVEVCRAGLAGQPARAKAAAECLHALGEATPLPARAAAEPPPVDVAAVIGKHLFWHLATSRGEVVIELRPDVAPWAVASIVALTRRGFYNGLEFHRVVPNFVVQGGDPTMSGWGGPGYTLPAEPASGRDGPGYVAGGVGIADAGRDSGGSQWFIMHSRAPHLDGRYTWIGSVVAGQKSADALLIGDRVERATIEQR
jgi:cyclophilin family peptidyl-prolyl cis-trans isomerase/HEAT repeat protein